MTALRFLSVCSGMGGFDLGLERAGFECSAQIEIDGNANAVLAQHWPAVPRLGDLTKVQGEDDRIGAIDLLVGGTPCQDLSVAGKRAGLAGKRSGLFYSFARLITECAPKWVLFENVPGLLSSNGGRDMAAVVGALGERGYGWAYRILDAQYFGVAQRRRRVFLVGCAGGRTDLAAQVLFESESCGRDTPSRRAPREGITHSTAGSLTSSGRGVSRTGETRGQDPVIAVAETLGGGTGNRGWSSDTDWMTFLPEVALALSTKEHFNDAQQTYIPDVYPTVAAGAHPGGLNGQGAENSIIVPDVAPAITAKQAYGSGGPAGDEAQNLVAIAFTERTRDGERNVEAQEELAYAITNPGAGGRTQERRLMQGMAVRRLTPTECLRLQGFPDDWLDIPGLSDSSKYRLAGNAVCVPVVEWIGRRIMAVDRDR